MDSTVLSEYPFLHKYVAYIIYVFFRINVKTETIRVVYVWHSKEGIKIS